MYSSRSQQSFDFWWGHETNRRFPSCLSPLFQSESQCEAFHMEISFIHMYKWTQICVWIKLISIWKASHCVSLWNRQNATRKSPSLLQIAPLQDDLMTYGTEVLMPMYVCMYLYLFVCLFVYFRRWKLVIHATAFASPLLSLSTAPTSSTRSISNSTLSKVQQPVFFFRLKMHALE